MTGEAHWLTLALIFASGVFVALLSYYVNRIGRRYITHRRNFVCPVSDETVEGKLIRDEKTRKWTGIVSCSAFANPASITCDRVCVTAGGQ